MTKTFDEHAVDDLKQVLAYLVIRWNCTDAYLAKRLECSPQTVSNLRAGKLSCSSKYTERIRRYAYLEKKKQNEEEQSEIRRLL